MNSIHSISSLWVLSSSFLSLSKIKSVSIFLYSLNVMRFLSDLHIEKCSDVLEWTFLMVERLILLWSWMIIVWVPIFVFWTLWFYFNTTIPSSDGSSKGLWFYCLRAKVYWSSFYSPCSSFNFIFNLADYIA